MGINGIRKTLQAGATVFAFSALLLFLLPSLFLDLLGMDSGDQLQWSMRMIGITVFALAGICGRTQNKLMNLELLPLRESCVLAPHY